MSITLLHPGRQPAESTAEHAELDPLLRLPMRAWKHIVSVLCDGMAQATELGPSAPELTRIRYFSSGH
jgi:hypothetical protein